MKSLDSQIFGWITQLKDGFEGDGYQCGDEDECKNGTHDCHGLSQCKNTLGSYSCTCNEGTSDGATNRVHVIRSHQIIKDPILYPYAIFYWFLLLKFQK